MVSSVAIPYLGCCHYDEEKEPEAPNYVQHSAYPFVWLGREVILRSGMRLAQKMPGVEPPRQAS